MADSQSRPFQTRLRDRQQSTFWNLQDLNDCAGNRRMPSMIIEKRQPPLEDGSARKT